MILLIGPASVGKTLLLKRLQNNNPTAVKEEVPSTIPTVGTNLVTITCLKKTGVTVREVGGAMGPIWHSFYQEAHAIIFMMDISRHVQVAITCVQLMTMLSHPSIQNISVLILLNKVDVPGGMSRPELESLMRLEDVVRCSQQKITLLETSAKTGQNLDKVAKWIYDQNKLEPSSEAS